MVNNSVHYKHISMRTVIFPMQSYNKGKIIRRKQYHHHDQIPNSYKNKFSQKTHILLYI